ncbi:unnamed protein product, partial [Laminaria digitata]
GKGTGVCDEHARGIYSRRALTPSLATCDLPYPTACGLLDLLTTCLLLAKIARFYSYSHSQANFLARSYLYFSALLLTTARSPRCRPPRFPRPTPAPDKGLPPGCPVPRRAAGSRKDVPAAPSLPASDDYN